MKIFFEGQKRLCWRRELPGQNNTSLVLKLTFRLIYLVPHVQILDKIPPPPLHLLASKYADNSISGPVAWI